MKMNELMVYILVVLPEAIFSEDESGEVIISTGMKVLQDDELESLELE